MFPGSIAKADRGHALTAAGCSFTDQQSAWRTGGQGSSEARAPPPGTPPHPSPRAPTLAPVTKTPDPYPFPSTTLGKQAGRGGGYVGVILFLSERN